MDPGSNHDQPGREQLVKFDDFLVRLQRTMHMQLQEAAQRFRITASQIFILRYLAKQGPTKASDIAKFVGLSPGAVTQVCDELVKVDCVERARSDEDRRVVYVEITGTGKQRLEEIRRFHQATTEKVLRQLGPQDAGDFLRLVGRVVEIVEADLGSKS